MHAFWKKRICSLLALLMLLQLAPAAAFAQEEPTAPEDAAVEETLPAENAEPVDADGVESTDPPAEPEDPEQADDDRDTDFDIQSTDDRIDGAENEEKGNPDRVLTLTSRTAETAGSVALLAGGGVYADGTEVTVTAYPRHGYTFVGWYDAEDAAFANRLSSLQSYSFTIGADLGLVALYAPSAAGSFPLKVNASKFTVNGGPEQSGMAYLNYSAGEQMFLRFTDTDSEFLYWVNRAGNILSTQRDFSFYMIGDTEITAICAAGNTGAVLVVFRNAYAQVISSQSYTPGESIAFPEVPPTLMGGVFDNWYIADAEGSPTQTVATDESIWAAMESGETVLVVPGYIPMEETYSVHVRYTDGTDDLRESVTVTERIGSGVTFTAPEIEGKVFRYWKLNGVTVGYGAEQEVIMGCAGSAELEAVYGDAAAQEEAAVVITQTYARKSDTDGKYIISNTMQYYIPEEYIVAEIGFVYGTRKALFGAEDGAEKLVIGGAYTYTHATGFTDYSGRYTFSGHVTQAGTVLFAKAYAVLKDREGNARTVYSDMTAMSYDSFLETCGHVWGAWSTVTAPTCTEAGVETHTCARCGRTETRAAEALGHDWGAWSTVTAPTCTEAGVETHTCSRCGETETRPAEALGHDWGEPVWTWTGNETDGYTAASATFTCTRDLTHTGTAEATVTSADGTGEDAGYLVYTATAVFNDAAFTDTKRIPVSIVTVTFRLNLPDGASVPDGTAEEYTQTVTGNEGEFLGPNAFAVEGYAFCGWNTAADGTGTAYADGASAAGLTEDVTLYARWTGLSAFTHSDSFASAERYRYRVGNGNAVKLGSLFKVAEYGDAAPVSGDIRIMVSGAEPDSSVYTGPSRGIEAGSTADCVYTADASDWTLSTLKFRGEGPVSVEIREGENGARYTLELEVVNGKNATAAANATGNNVVLLNDVSGGLTISGGYTLYGNGFAVYDTRNQPGGTAGYVSISNGTADNVRFIGYEPEKAVVSGVDSAGYAPAVLIGSGGARICNCYISGGRYAVMAEYGGSIDLYGTTLDGGAIGNLCLSKGHLTMENCVTTKSTRGGLKGLGIHVTRGTDVSVTLKGSFTQHNWMTEDEIPSTYRGIFNSVYNDPAYAYTVGGKTYVNMGILFLSTASDITEADVRAVLSDSTGNDYGFIQKTSAGVVGTSYTARSGQGSEAAVGEPAYEGGQYVTQPACRFDYTGKNYIARTDGSNLFCYYDAASGEVKIGFDRTDDSAFFAWDPYILTVTKYGNTLPYSVSMGAFSGSSAAGGDKILLTESGSYTVTYTYTDPYNYRGGSDTPFSVTYTREVKLDVLAAAPESVVYAADFAYTGDWANAARKTVINNNTYVMPDVGAAGGSIGSTTVGGQTVYFPVVSVPATGSDGNTAYASGKGYYFAPAFSALSITDYDQETGAAQYTYNSSSETWPHGRADSAGPDAAVFGYDAGAAYANQPYGRSMNAQYYGYGRNDSGLCYTSKEIEKDNAASSHLVRYHYVSNDGTTYYWYIRYDFGAMTHAAGCVPSGTMVTMADGTKKPVEDVTDADRVLVFNHETGTPDTAGIIFTEADGTAEYSVVNLTFSDGSTTRLIDEHGYFDLDLMQYVYIREDNCADYIGHRFYKINGGAASEATLTDAFVTVETTGCFSFPSVYHLNFFADDFLSMPGGITGMFNIFAYDAQLKYDGAAKAADIETYGLMSCEDFAGCLTEEEFAMYPAQYLRVSLGKGLMTPEWLEYLIGRYVADKR